MDNQSLGRDKRDEYMIAVIGAGFFDYAWQTVFFEEACEFSDVLALWGIA
jgi:hypothetical protein